MVVLIQIDKQQPVKYHDNCKTEAVINNLTQAFGPGVLERDGLAVDSDSLSGGEYHFRLAGTPSAQQGLLLEATRDALATQGDRLVMERSSAETAREGAEDTAVSAGVGVCTTESNGEHECKCVDLQEKPSKKRARCATNSSAQSGSRSTPCLVDVARPSFDKETSASLDGMEEKRKTGQNWLYHTYFKGAVSSGFSIPKDTPRSEHPTLMERDEQIREIARVWEKAEKARGLEIVHRDRYHFKIPVCVGMPGTGKTRLLREYPRIIECANLTTRKTAALCVTYSDSQSADRTLDIRVSFAARMLHAAFKMQEQGDSSLEEFLQHVETTPSVQRHFSIFAALRAYRAALVAQGFIAEEEVLQVVLAVDDFQFLDVDRLQSLVTSILDVYITLDPSKINLFLVFAGMEWDKIDLWSTKACLRKISTKFLGFASARQIALEIYPEGKYNQQFLRHAMALGDIPEQVVMFAREVAARSEGNVNNHLTD